jgi:uncharacterized alpha/beta hydrolase family protein
VYVIHGYGSSRLMMHKIVKEIRKADFITENYAYNSIRDDLDTIGKKLYLRIKKDKPDTVSFVSHSMGALAVRSMIQYAIKDKDFPVIFRIVMIAPPNKGAQIADFYSSVEILKRLLGPNIGHMRTDPDSYAHKLPIPQNSEIGIIAGLRGKKKGYNLFMKGDNDGYLTPEKTKLGIEKDFVILKSEHNFLTQNKQVCQLITEFLKLGYFKSKENNLDLEKQ